MKITTMDELKARHAKELLELERREALRGDLPATEGEPPRIGFYDKDCPWIIYKPATIAAAWAILNSYDERVPFELLLSSSIYTEPRELIPAKEWDSSSVREETNGMDGAVLNIEGGEGHGPDADLHIWARVSGQIIMVRCDFNPHSYPAKEYPAEWHALHAVDYDRYGSPTVRRSEPPKVFADITKKMWSSPEGYSYRFLWHEWATLENELARLSPGLPHYERGAVA
jgi:hypothetical protein